MNFYNEAKAAAFFSSIVSIFQQALKNLIAWKSDKKHNFRLALADILSGVACVDN